MFCRAGNFASLVTTASIGLFVGGCVLKPQEAGEQNRRLAAESAKLGYGNADRNSVQDLPDSPTWRDILHRAFLANGDLEASYHEWAMAVHRIDQAGTWPNQSLELGFEYMFSAERMKSFDRTTIMAGLGDSAEMPNKTFANATVAWREAQSAGEKFRAAKFSLQKQILQSWSEYCLQAEKVRIQEENVNLLNLVASTAASRVRAGGAQQEQVRADVQFKLAETELATSQSLLLQQRAMLNGLLRRDPAAPILAPVELPQARVDMIDDQSLLSAGVSNNPDLAALGFDENARSVAIERARMEYLPEINPTAAFTGSISQSVGASIMLPTQLPKIRAMVEESRADLRRVQASYMQAKSDRAARFALAVLAMRDAERRAKVISDEILPLARRTVELSRQGYASGTVGYLDLIDSQRTLLDTRLMLAESLTSREKMLAEIEELAGMDAETIHQSPTTKGVP